MLGDKDDTGELRRDFIRALVPTEALEVEVRTKDGRVAKGSSQNISVTGVYVVSKEATVAPDEDLQLLIGSLSGTAALRIEARVVHAERGTGFGARFVAPAQEAHGYLEALIARLRKPL